MGEERRLKSRSLVGLGTESAEDEFNEGLTLSQESDIVNLDRVIPITQEAINSFEKIVPEGWTEELVLKLQSAHKELLTIATKYPPGTEVGRVFASDMRSLTDVIVGEKGQIQIASFNEPYIVIHNHPDGLSFSKGDIENFILRYDMQVMTAIGNNGIIYLVQKTDNYIASDFVFEFSREIKKLNKIVETGTTVEYDLEISNFLKGAKKYGILYTETIDR